MSWINKLSKSAEALMSSVARTETKFGMVQNIVSKDHIVLHVPEGMIVDPQKLVKVLHVNVFSPASNREVSSRLRRRLIVFTQISSFEQLTTESVYECLQSGFAIDSGIKYTMAGVLWVATSAKTPDVYAAHMNTVEIPKDADIWWEPEQMDEELILNASESDVPNESVKGPKKTAADLKNEKATKSA